MVKDEDICKKLGYLQSEYKLELLDPERNGEYFQEIVDFIRESSGIVKVEIFLEVPNKGASAPRDWIDNFHDAIDITNVEAEMEIRCTEIKENTQVYEAVFILDHWCYPEPEE
jgi:hypothetical protein